MCSLPLPYRVYKELINIPSEALSLKIGLELEDVCEIFST